MAPDPVPVLERADRLRPEELKERLVLADTAALALGLVLAFAIQRVVRPVPVDIMVSHAILLAASLPGFFLGGVATRLHQARANARVEQEFGNIVRTVLCGAALLVSIGFAVQYQHLSRFWVMLMVVGAIGSLTVERHFARRLFARLREEGRLRRRIVIVGTDAHAIGLMNTYHRNARLGYEVVGFVGDDAHAARGGIDVLGPVSELPEILDGNDTVGVVISLSSVSDDDVNRITRELTDDGYHVALSSALSDIDVSRLRPQELDGRTMIYIEPVIRHGWRAVAKRLFDIAAACTLLVLSLPVLVIAAIAIKLDSRGPILFRQERVGRHGQLFNMIKLRTMAVDAEQRRDELLDQNEADGPLFKMSHDPRITRVGRILRKLSIDELPQLVTVIEGTMSMVGPRPALPSEVEHWDEPLHDRLRVPPGLTGLWQVSGRSDSAFEDYRRLDLFYVDNWSLAHDLRICARTIGAVVKSKGAV